MPPKAILSFSHEALIRRYLIWAYKSTKESFDRLERKTTQLMADEHIAQVLAKGEEPAADFAAEYETLVDDFAAYMARKKEQPIPRAQYLYLQNRVHAVEQTIIKFLGKKELAAIQKAYEVEFTRRIWESKEH